MKTFNDLINEALEHVPEIMPWDLEEKLTQDNKPLIVDVREPSEYDTLHIDGSIFAPRGILETACEWNYDDTIPELVNARDREIVVVCRSGNRSVLAARTMQLMGYKNVCSLKTGIRGWNDYEQPLINAENQPVDIDDADEFLASKVRDDQLEPK